MAVPPAFTLAVVGATLRYVAAVTAETFRTVFPPNWSDNKSGGPKGDTIT